MKIIEGGVFMECIEPIMLQALPDNEPVFVSKALINYTVAYIRTSNREITPQEHRLVQLMHNSVVEEIEKRTIIPRIKMTAKEAKEFFPDYKTLARGYFTIIK